MKWINAKEKVPCEDEWYDTKIILFSFYCDNCGNFEKTQNVSTGFFSGGRWSLCDFDDKNIIISHFKINVMYYLDVPEEPKENK